MRFDFSRAVYDFEIDRYQQNEGGRSGEGRNRMSSWLNDIVIVRVGQDAMEHFAGFDEHLLKEISRQRVLQETKVGDISRTYEDVEGRFRVTLQHLQHGEKLISYKILTRGFRLDFIGMSNVCFARLRRP